MGFWFSVLDSMRLLFVDLSVLWGLLCIRFIVVAVWVVSVVFVCVCCVLYLVFGVGFELHDCGCCLWS